MTQISLNKFNTNSLSFTEKQEKKIIKKHTDKMMKLAMDVWEESQRDDISLEFCHHLQDISSELRKLADDK